MAYSRVTRSPCPARERLTAPSWDEGLRIATATHEALTRANFAMVAAAEALARADGAAK